VGAAHAGPRGLPFQLPTELADGLGLESGLGTDYPVPFAPSSRYLYFEEFGSPASGFRKEAELRLQTWRTLGSAKAMSSHGRLTVPRLWGGVSYSAGDSGSDQLRAPALHCRLAFMAFGVAVLPQLAGKTSCVKKPLLFVACTGRIGTRIVTASTEIIVVFADGEILTFNHVDEAKNFLGFYNRSASASAANPAKIYLFTDGEWQPLK